MANPISQFMRSMKAKLAHWPVIPDDSNDEYANMTFAERMVKQVQNDFIEAESFLSTLHTEMDDMHAAYHNARDYVSVRTKKRFPVPMMQEQVDQFVAAALDKMFYGGRPSSVVPLPGTEKEDADAKQEMLDWQDFVQKIRLLFGLFLKDVALYRFCCAKVENVEKTRKVWTTIDVPVTDELGQPMLDEMSGLPASEPAWNLEDRCFYKGAWVTRIDPLNVYFGPNKSDIDDEYPIMVKAEYPKRYFYSRPYFFNQAELMGASTAHNEKLDSKRTRLGMGSGYSSGNADLYEYIEWQGLVDKAELYQFQMTVDPEFDQSLLATVQPDERTWAIVGVVNGETLVRCEENPFKLDGPNLIIGVMEPEEGELIGASLAQKILPSHKGLEEMFGILMENFKQAVNFGWGIDWNKVMNKQESINKPGFVLQTQGDPNQVMKRFEPYPIAKDIYAVSEYIRQMGQDAGGGQDMMTGKGDPGTNTLGESQMVFMKATLRLNRYIESFETSFIQPLYSMRNHINMVFIDEEFAYYIVADKQWVKIDPATVRADVDFICQSAQRETNRAVLTSQLLQLQQLLPAMLQAGQPVRLDVPASELARQAFGWKEELIERIFPLLKFEHDHPEMDINQMLVENALLQMGLSRMMAVQQAAMGMAGAPGPNQQLPQPKTESDASTSALQRGKPANIQADF